MLSVKQPEVTNTFDVQSIKATHSLFQISDLLQSKDKSGILLFLISISHLQKKFDALFQSAEQKNITFF